MTRLVVALGGNAIARAGERGTWEEARAHARQAVAPLAKLARKGHELLLTHGNGPQVGNLLLQQESVREVPPLPLDAVGAATQGWIGYLLQQELGAALERAHVPRTVVPIVTRVEVDAKDPAFKSPSKPVGRYYEENEAHLLMKQKGWVMRHDMARGGWRRIVPSPLPRRVVEGAALRSLLDAGLGHRIVPIVAGGGGVPVVEHGKGRYEGVEAVIDKDRTASLIASSVGASELAVLTDVPYVCVAFHTPRERRIGRTTPQALRRLLEDGQFGEGSMRPKVEAALDFLDHGGKRAVITDIDHFAAALRGEAGTVVDPLHED